MVREDRGVPYIVVKMPESLLYQPQRRRTTRYDAADTSFTATVFYENKTSIKMIDLSVGGCKVVFPQTSKSDLTVGMTMSNCHLRLNAGLNIQATGIVRHTSKLNDITVLAGIEFVEMDIFARRQLGSYLRRREKPILNQLSTHSMMTQAVSIVSKPPRQPTCTGF